MKNVVVGIIYKIVDGSKKYLLVSSTRNFGENTGKSYPVGGHIEDGENEVDALRREAFEELGIEIFPNKKVTQSLGDVPNQLTHWWLCDQIAEDTLLKIDDNEIKEVAWLTKDEIISRKDSIWPATYLFFIDTLFKEPSNR